MTLKNGLLFAMTGLLTGTAALAIASAATQPQGAGEMPRTREAAELRAREGFAKLDADGDGYVTKEEMDALREKMREAHPRGQRGGMDPEKLDLDGDGQITRDEAVEAAVSRFDEMDANGDGEVTREEARAAREADDTRRPQSFSREQMSEFAGKRFDRVDADNDGVLSDEELEKQPRRRFGGRRGGGEGGGKPRGMDFNGRADTDEDGKISEAEHVAQAVAHFDRLDTDGDGELSDAELEAAKGRFGSRRKGGQPE